MRVDETPDTLARAVLEIDATLVPGDHDDDVQLFGEAWYRLLKLARIESEKDHSREVLHSDLTTTNRAGLERDHRELDALREFRAGVAAAAKATDLGDNALIGFVGDLRAGSEQRDDLVKEREEFRKPQLDARDPDSTAFQEAEKRHQRELHTLRSELAEAEDEATQLRAFKKLSTEYNSSVTAERDELKAEAIELRAYRATATATINDLEKQLTEARDNTEEQIERAINEQLPSEAYLAELAELEQLREFKAETDLELRQLREVKVVYDVQRPELESLREFMRRVRIEFAAEDRPDVPDSALQDELIKKLNERFEKGTEWIQRDRELEQLREFKATAEATIAAATSGRTAALDELESLREFKAAAEVKFDGDAKAAEERARKNDAAFLKLEEELSALREFRNEVGQQLGYAFTRTNHPGDSAALLERLAEFKIESSELERANGELEVLREFKDEVATKLYAPAADPERLLQLIDWRAENAAKIAADNAELRNANGAPKPKRSRTKKPKCEHCGETHASADCGLAPRTEDGGQEFEPIPPPKQTTIDEAIKKQKKRTRRNKAAEIVNRMGESGGAE
jgi:hypothetical protein